MECGEESPVSRVPLVDRVSARTRGSRPVLVLFHLLTYSMYLNHLPPTGEPPGHYTTLGVIHSQVARNIRRLSLYRRVRPLRGR